MLVCALGTLATSSGSSQPSAALAALLLSLIPAALWQLFSLALGRVLRPRLAALAERLSLGRFVSRDRAAPREPVIALHAALLALVAWIALFAVGAQLLLARLRAIESTRLRELLSVTGLTGIAVLMLGLAALAFIGLRTALRRIDQRAPLPLPPSPGLRRLIWLGLPSFLGALAALLVLEPRLGPLGAPLWLLLVIGVQCALHASLSLLPFRARAGGRTRRVLALVAVAVLLVGIGTWGAERMLAGSNKTSVALEQARPTGLLLSVARDLTDFDRDGASAWFGEHDCAGFSAARGPLAREVPDNGVDENCDGVDDKPGAVPKAPVFYGELSEEHVADYDIVWFVIDAVRADHTSLLGYNRPTTPNIDELAKESLVFSRAYSQSSATMLSIPSMLTGIDPGHLEWVEESHRLQVSSAQRRYVSDMVEAHGYKTGIIAVTYFKNRLPGLLSGFDSVEFGATQKENSRTTAVLASRFIIEARRKPKPFMLLTYMAAPHAPYVRHGPGYPKFGKGELADYDTEISNADRHLGFILDVLRADPKRWKKTIVIVSSDHGEEFGEHGQHFHARTCHVESLHVPLVVRIPGQKPARIDRPVGLVDITPTLLELIGATDQAPATLDGSSLLHHTHAPERLAEDRPLFCTVVSQTRGLGDFARRSVQSGPWKLMTELRGSKPPQLYDVTTDPKEENPLELTGERRQVAKKLGVWLKSQLTGNVHLIDMTD